MMHFAFKYFTDRHQTVLTFPELLLEKKIVAAKLIGKYWKVSDLIICFTDSIPLSYLLLFLLYVHLSFGKALFSRTGIVSMLQRISNVSRDESLRSTLQVPYYFSCAYEFARIFFRSIVKSLEYACCDPERKRIKLKQEQHCILGF